jgi:rubredoxin
MSNSANLYHCSACSWSGSEPDESDASDVDPKEPWRMRYVVVLYCPHCHKVIK